MQAAWHRRQRNAFGVPLQVPHSCAKSDWALFTAAWLADQPVAQESVHAYADGTPDRVFAPPPRFGITGRKTRRPVAAFFCAAA